MKVRPSLLTHSKSRKKSKQNKKLTDFNTCNQHIFFSNISHIARLKDTLVEVFNTSSVRHFQTNGESLYSCLFSNDNDLAVVVSDALSKKKKSFDVLYFLKDVALIALTCLQSLVLVQP